MEHIFPAGLVQPIGSYRFGADALLLAAFSAREVAGKKQAPLRVAELGTGCGACLFAFMLLVPDADCLGLDCEPDLLAAARLNAMNLGLQARVKFEQADLEKDAPAQGGAYQLVMANPPWLKPGSGRLPKGQLRQRAICQRHGTLEAFCNCASSLLRHGGCFCLILPPGLLPDFCDCAGGLGLRKILPVASHAGGRAARVLLLARKGAASDPDLLAPLNLHDSNGWTREALEFCPWLGKASI